MSDPKMAAADLAEAVRIIDRLLALTISQHTREHVLRGDLGHLLNVEEDGLLFILRHHEGERGIPISVGCYEMAGAVRNIAEVIAETAALEAEAPSAR